MAEQSPVVIHWFRRDLRLDDNTALIAASRYGERLIPVFVFDPVLLRSSRVQGSPRIGFMLDCLTVLDKTLRERGSALVVRMGDPAEELVRLVRETGAQRVTFNRDYTPYAVNRDERVSAALRAEGVQVDHCKDMVLHESREVLSETGNTYRVFTPYKNRWLMAEKTPPQNDLLNGAPPPLLEGVETGRLPTLEMLGGTHAAQPITQAGEAAARKRLRDFLDGGMSGYDEGRDQLSEDGTSQLSAHLRWGTLSVRRCYQAALQGQRTHANTRGAAVWISELAWRDFYQMILALNPRVTQGSFKPEFDRVQWQTHDGYFKAWCEGRTGYPVVDAAMRQLNETGWMHNRARMITASFLVKDLLMDWRAGEQYFMQKLIDGDVAANNGGWQWVAGTGTDAAPYFRVFNPTAQGEKFDADGTYIRRWIPELGSVPTRFIHMPDKLDPRPDYPLPVVDHRVQRTRVLALYGSIKAE